MCHHIATNWLLWIHCICHATTWVSCHLVCDEDCHIELFTDFLQSAENPVQDLLTFCELSTTREVNSKWCHDRVDYKQSVLVINHCSCCLHQQIDKTVNSEGTSHKNVIENTLMIQIESICDCFDSLRSECVLGVDIQDFPCSASL